MRKHGGDGSMGSRGTSIFDHRHKIKLSWMRLQGNTTRRGGGARHRSLGWRDFFKKRVGIDIGNASSTAILGWKEVGRRGLSWFTYIQWSIGRSMVLEVMS